MPKFKTAFSRLLYRLIAAVVLVATVLAWFWLARDPQLLSETLKAGSFSMAATGKFIILWGFDGSSRLGPFGLALLVFVIDVNIAVILTSGAEYLERLPGFGRWLRYLRTRARRALDENPGLGNMAFFGVVLYVFLPLAATGAVTGTLAARLLGFSRLAGLLAVGLGSASISLAFALVAHFGKQHAEAFGYKPLAAALVVVVALGWLVVRRVRVILRRGAADTSEPA